MLVHVDHGYYETYLCIKSHSDDISGLVYQKKKRSLCVLSLRSLSEPILSRHIDTHTKSPVV